MPSPASRTLHPLLATSFTAILLACGGTAEQPHAPVEAQEQPAVEVIGTGVPIVGEWRATGVTVDGKQDPDMDPTGKVKWSIRADSSFSMWDATVGGPDSMTGKWRLDQAGIFHMIAPDAEELPAFKVLELTADSLCMRVLEDPGTEVLLYFARN